MAIDAKISFINQIETGLATEVTLDAMNRVMRIVADTLEGYEMRETFETEEGKREFEEWQAERQKSQLNKKQNKESR